MLIKAYSLGINYRDFWRYTPFQFYLIVKGNEEKQRFESIPTIALINIVKGMFGDKDTISYNKLIGKETIEDMNFKTFHDFRKPDGKTDWEAFNKYLQEEVVPWKKAKGLI